MDKEIYKYLKDADIIGSMSEDIVEAFKTKMNEDTVDYSFDIAKGTGRIKVVEPNTFFNFDTDKHSSLDKFKKALFNDDLAELTQDQEVMLIEDVSEFLKEVATYIMDNYEQEIRDSLRAAIMPRSQPEDFPFERIYMTAIDIADWSSVPEPQKYLLVIGKENGAFINTDVVINYVQNRQEETGMTVKEVFEEGKTERNPLFKQIISIEQGDRYLYEINVTLFVDYSLAEKSMEELAKIKEANEKALEKAAIEHEEKLEDDIEIRKQDKIVQKIRKELE